MASNSSHKLSEKIESSGASFDLVVVGAGAAGMMGALVAAHRGARVALLEHDLAGDSNLKVSGGLFPAAGSRFQMAAGVVDSGLAFAADIRAKAAGSINESIVDAIAAHSLAVVDFLADDVGLPLHLAATVPAPGHAVPRLHATPNESGRELHLMLRAAVAARREITIVDRATPVAFHVTRDRVTGVNTLLGHDTHQDYRAAAVLIATGGFAGDARLVATHLPQMRDALHIGAGPNDGIALRLAQPLGAALAMMAGYQGQGHVNPRGGTRLGMGLPHLGAFMINRDCRRFVREDIGPSDLARHVLTQPGGVALEVFDERCHLAASRQGPYREAFTQGNVLTAATIASLAVLVDISPDALSAAITLFERHARGLTPDPLGRQRFGPPLAPPYYAAWVTGALAHTQGGLRVDSMARVVRDDGSPIAGLYAAGGAAASLAGAGGDGYLPGNGLAQSFGLALIAARHATSLTSLM